MHFGQKCKSACFGHGTFLHPPCERSNTHLSLRRVSCARNPHPPLWTLCTISIFGDCSLGKGRSRLNISSGHCISINKSIVGVLGPTLFLLGTFSQTTVLKRRPLSASPSLPHSLGNGVISTDLDPSFSHQTSTVLGVEPVIRSSEQTGTGHRRSQQQPTDSSLGKSRFGNSLQSGSTIWTLDGGVDHS